MKCSEGLNKMIDSWLDIANSKNLSPNQSTKKGESVYRNYTVLGLLRYSIVQQGLKEEIINLKDLNFHIDEIERQLNAVVEIIYRTRGPVEIG